MSFIRKIEKVKRVQESKKNKSLEEVIISLYEKRKYNKKIKEAIKLIKNNLIDNAYKDKSLKTIISIDTDIVYQLINKLKKNNIIAKPLTSDILIRCLLKLCIFRIKL